MMLSAALPIQNAITMHTMVSERLNAAGIGSRALSASRHLVRPFLAILRDIT